MPHKRLKVASPCMMESEDVRLEGQGPTFCTHDIFSSFASEFAELNYPNFIEALKQNSVEQVANYLKFYPSLISMVNAQKQTPLHLVLQYGKYELVQIILKELQDENLAEILMAPDVDGFTPLHYAAQYADFITFKSVIVKLGEDKINSACVQKSNEGYLPTHLVKYNPNANDLSFIQSILDSFPIKHPSQKLELSEIKDVYDSVTNGDIYFLLNQENISNACDALNFARSVIENPRTHPFFNCLDSNLSQNIIGKNDKTRLLYWLMNDQMNNIDNEEAKKLLSLKNIVSTVCQSQQGSCIEHSCLILWYLIQNKITQVEVYHVLNGDHAFIVLGRPKNSHETNYSTWGDSTIIVDGWSGNIFPPSKIPEMLKCHHLSYYLHNGENIEMHSTLPFDDKVHSLNLSTYINFSDSFLEKIKKGQYPLTLEFQPEFVINDSVSIQSTNNSLTPSLESLNLSTENQASSALMQNSLFSQMNLNQQMLTYPAELDITEFSLSI